MIIAVTLIIVSTTNIALTVCQVVFYVLNHLSSLASDAIFPVTTRNFLLCWAYSFQNHDKSLYGNGNNNSYHLLSVCYVSGPGLSALHALEKVMLTVNGMTRSIFIYQAQTLAGPSGDKTVTQT